MKTFQQFILEATKPRVYYHGTPHWNKISKSGELRPHIADAHGAGKAVWFTTDKENAQMFAGKRGKILSITHKNLKTMKHKIFSAEPRGFVKKFGLDRKKNPYEADVVVHQKIPLKHIKVEDNN